MDGRGVAEGRKVLAEMRFQIMDMYAYIFDKITRIDCLLDIDDLGAVFAHDVKAVLHRGVYIAVDVLRAEEAAQHPDAPAAQAVVVERVEIAWRNAPDATFRDWVLGVAAGDHVEHARGVGDGARERAGRILCKRIGDDAVAADKPDCWTDADEGIGRRRRTDRVDCVRPDSGDAEVGGQTGPRPARRAAGGAGVVVGVVCLAEDRADCLAPDREFM